MSTSDSEIPLTFSQQLLWMLDFVLPGRGFAPGYIVRGRYVLTGPVEVELIRAALQRVIDRHDALRTTIETRGATPTQRVHAVAAAHVEVVPIEDATRGGWRDAFFVGHEIVKRDVCSPPVIWLRLGRVSATEYLVSIVAHHAVVDYWSIEIVVAELASYYRLLVEGGAESLGPATQHSDYSIAQQNQDNPKLAGDLSFWKSTLADIRPGPLTVEHSREGLSGRQEVIRLTIDAALTARTRAAARAARASMFMIMLSAYVSRLARMSEMRDLVVPTITPARYDPETRKVIGYMTNVVPLRIRLTADPSLGEILRIVRHVCLEAFSHEVPLILLLDHLPDAALMLSDDLYLTAPFQFVDNYDAKSYDFGNGCRCRQVLQDEQSQVVSIPVEFLTSSWPHGDDLVLELAYTEGLIAPSRVTALGRGTIKMLEHLVSRPDTRVSETEL